MRGIPRQGRSKVIVTRITPAHAGNTTCLPSPQSSLQDHPRACGEYVPSILVVLPLGGSPPRMRGIPKFPEDYELYFRITPAHAGNTPEDFVLVEICEDHPRACGEYTARQRAEADQIGSPPRMRGIPSQINGARPNEGITPAHAGNTGTTISMNRPAKDHPRACGEYTKKSHDIAVHLARNPNFYLVSKFTRMES